jgi:hypothetical protein
MLGFFISQGTYDSYFRDYRLYSLRDPFIDGTGRNTQGNLSGYFMTSKNTNSSNYFHRQLTIHLDISE